jgi:hypothetical protein
LWYPVDLVAMIIQTATKITKGTKESEDNHFFLFVSFVLFVVDTVFSKSYIRKA